MVPRAAPLRNRTAFQQNPPAPPAAPGPRGYACCAAAHRPTQDKRHGPRGAHGWRTSSSGATAFVRAVLCETPAGSVGCGSCPRLEAVLVEEVRGCVALRVLGAGAAARSWGCKRRSRRRAYSPAPIAHVEQHAQEEAGASCVLCPCSRGSAGFIRACPERGATQWPGALAPMDVPPGAPTRRA